MDRYEIGLYLHISPLTAKYHTEHILRKLGAKNRTHAAAIWARSEADVAV